LPEKKVDCTIDDIFPRDINALRSDHCTSTDAFRDVSLDRCSMFITLDRDARERFGEVGDISL
jgi:hypothetical protein